MGRSAGTATVPPVILSDRTIRAEIESGRIGVEPYDPAMVQQFVLHPDDYLIWHHYEAITCPVLCLRGEHSDLVLPEVVADMHVRGPGLRGQLQVVEVPDCGHAPALNVASHFKWVTEFLKAAEQAEAGLGL